MKLGTLAYITVHTKDQDRMLDQMRSLGFRDVASDYASRVMSDGVVYFDIRRSVHNITMLSYIVNDIHDTVERANNLQLDIIETSPDHAIIKDPNGMFVLLLPIYLMPLAEAQKNPFSLCGTFTGIGITTPDTERALRWWNNVGFKQTAGTDKTATLDDGKIIMTVIEEGKQLRQDRHPIILYRTSKIDECREVCDKNGIAYKTFEPHTAKRELVMTLHEGPQFILFENRE